MSGGFALSRDYCNGASVVDAANSRGIAVTCGTANAYGSYTQLTASTATDTAWLIITLTTNGSVNSANNQSIKIAVGGAGSEVDIIPDLSIFAGNAGLEMEQYVFPVNIPGGTRLSASGKCNVGTDAVYVAVELFDAAFSGEGCAHVDSIGVNNVGTAITAGAANVKGSYSQLVASSLNDYFGLYFNVGAPTNNGNIGAAGIGSWLIDIAIGGAGSEQIIIPDNAFATNIQISPVLSGFYEISIPSGTRIAARGQCGNVTGGGIIGLSAYGAYQ